MKLYRESVIYYEHKRSIFTVYENEMSARSMGYVSFVYESSVR